VVVEVIWLQLLVYASIIIFAVLTMSKVIRYSTMPMHLRWELYPVPHERWKAKYGGGYYEESEWWKKPRETTLIGELKEMLLEMLFIKRVFEYKRSLWWLTFPFHFGIYLLLGWFALLFIGSLITMSGLGATFIETVVENLTLLTGSLGMILLVFGSVGLLFRRIFDKSLRVYSAPVDYFNLVFIIAVVVTGIVSWQLDPKFEIARTFMTSLVTFSTLPQIPDQVVMHVVLLSLLVAYIPTTRMTHFVGKYFTYHKVLWEDVPNLAGSPIREKVREVLAYKVTWSAPHIKPGISWAEEAQLIEPVTEIRAKLLERRKK
jgi:nitrate reductase gamma subunit